MQTSLLVAGDVAVDRHATADRRWLDDRTWVDVVRGYVSGADEVLVAPPSRRVGYGAALGALALMLVLYAALVGSLLRSRDVAVG